MLMLTNFLDVYIFVYLKKSHIPYWILHLQDFQCNVQHELATLKQEREVARRQLAKLEAHYTALMGRRDKAATELSAEYIQLPEAREDLELLALQLREEVVSVR
ncbi:unnamed protein product [Protopolystoma xenopodis]|uniref:Rabaptin GTPase-Rab5 binding domain-containing protein n=1 Tax=Protopolystoma xenopodis TaxID=117903 RepID=A0A3S5BSM8_9PLAT|nr:unnamed protein product [Protopolystoma xenopodis]